MCFSTPTLTKEKRENIIYKGEKANIFITYKMSLIKTTGTHTFRTSPATYQTTYKYQSDLTCKCKL